MHTLPTEQLHYHDGQADFPHGAGASEPGWYVYETEDLSDEPSGPFPTREAAYAWAVERLEY